MISHLIQGRVTAVPEKHVCFICGSNAYFLYINYEVITQKQVQALQDTKFVHPSGIVSYAHKSQVSIDAYQKTLREQEGGLPQEHYRTYQCLSCLNKQIALLLGGSQGTNYLWLQLMRAPFSSAVWILQEIATHRNRIVCAAVQDVKVMAEIIA